MKRSTVFVFLIGLLAVFSVILSKPIYYYYSESSLLKSFSSTSEGREFVKRNPVFIKSIRAYPDIIIFVKNCINITPEYYSIFNENMGFFEKLKVSQRLRNVYSFFSTFPELVKYGAANFVKLSSFVNQNPAMLEYLRRTPDYARYLCVEHLDKLNLVISSPDPRTAAMQTLEEYAIKNYIKLSGENKY